MGHYRRIEVTAFRRRVVMTSGGINTDARGDQAPLCEERVWLNDADSGEGIEVESAEGQLILADAVRSLQQLLPTEPTSEHTIPMARPCSFGRSVYSKLCRLRRTIMHPKSLSLTQKEK